MENEQSSQGDTGNSDFPLEIKKLKLTEDVNTVEQLPAEDNSDNNSDVADFMEDYEDFGTESCEDVELPLEQKKTEPTERSSHDEYPFQVLSPEQIVQNMVNCVRETSTLLQLPPAMTRSLLNHYGWDKDKLVAAFFDGDQDKFFLDAGVVNPFPVCEICVTLKPSSMMYAMGCGHRYCVECWSEYLTTKIREGMSVMIPCMHPNCPILVDDDSVMTLVTDSQVILKYQLLTTNSFVQSNCLLRWCPAPDCTKAICVQSVDWKPVTCTCSHVFCFQCGKDWHDPVKCNLLQKMLEKFNHDDFNSVQWISTNTKRCPKCDASIEKNGGCNHIHCAVCNVDFCWVCCKPYELHGQHNCNRFNESQTQGNSSELERKRYFFYGQRYLNHKKSLELEHKLEALMKDKMTELQELHNMPWIEAQFLKEAVDILRQCRQTLMYTYVFAYFVQTSNQSVMFESNQSFLESATEVLSEYLERDITSENLADVKQKVQDKSRYCTGHRQALLDHVNEGYENDWWVFNE